MRRRVARARRGRRALIGSLPNRLSDADTIAAEHMNRDERLWEQTGTAGAPQEFDIPIGEGGIENARFSFNWSNWRTSST